jgi:RND family efflux transporter MFP subunit
VKKSILCVLSLAVLAACQGGPAPDSSSPVEAVSVTRWTVRTELFLEHPRLVAGSVSRFSVHLTDLETFKPLTEGRVTVELRSPDGAVESFRTDAPSRPGIFGLDVKPAAAGRRTMAIRYESTAWSDAHDVGPVTVAAAGEKIEAAAEAELPDVISYLKEQQWTLDFATSVVAERPIRASLDVPGEIRPRTGGDVEVLVPVAGRLAAGEAIPSIGAPVRAGQALAKVIPRSGTPTDQSGLRAALREAEASLSLSRRDRERAERLAKAGAVPGKRLDEARATETVAEARFDAAKARLDQLEFSRAGADGGPLLRDEYVIRAPIDGVLAVSSGTPGAAVEEGERLFRIVALDPVHVFAEVPEASAWRLTDLAGGEMTLPGRTEPLALGRIVSIGRVVDPGSRTVPLVFEARNGNPPLSIGQSVHVRLFTGQTAKSPVIPESAVVDDAGRPVVFIQAAGESFLRRAVRLGDREGGSVQVLDGLRPGDRVVSAGGHQIRLATLSPQVPASGHVH